MAKIIAVIAILALLTVVQVSSFRTTTITTTIAEETKPQKCREEIQKKEKELMQCQLYLQQQSGDDQEQEHEHLKQCCSRLALFDAECRCEAIQHVVGRVQAGEGQKGEDEDQKMVEKARQLPQQCKMEEPKECPMIIRSQEGPYYYLLDPFFY